MMILVQLADVQEHLDHLKSNGFTMLHSGLSPALAAQLREEILAYRDKLLLSVASVNLQFSVTFEH
eukprot:399526-Hanusia_phi.AAC.2